MILCPYTATAVYHSPNLLLSLGCPHVPAKDSALLPMDQPSVNFFQFDPPLSRFFPFCSEKKTFSAVDVATVLLISMTNSPWGKSLSTSDVPRPDGALLFVSFRSCAFGLLLFSLFLCSFPGLNPVFVLRGSRLHCRFRHLKTLLLLGVCRFKNNHCRFVPFLLLPFWVAR